MKSKFEKLTKGIMNQFDRLQPLRHQETISRMVKWIPGKDSNRLPFIYDEARSLEFTEDLDWIFYFEGYSVHGGAGGDGGQLCIRICIRESLPTTGYVIFRYRDVQMDGDLEPKICDEFIRLGKEYFTTSKKKPAGSPGNMLSGYTCILKVANRMQREPLHRFSLYTRTTDHPAYFLVTMMMRIVEKSRLDAEMWEKMKKSWRDSIVTYNQEMGEINRKGVQCPNCESDKIKYTDGKDRRRSYWHCKGCGCQFVKEDLIEQT